MSYIVKLHKAKQCPHLAKIQHPGNVRIPAEINVLKVKSVVEMRVSNHLIPVHGRHIPITSVTYVNYLLNVPERCTFQVITPISEHFQFLLVL